MGLLFCCPSCGADLRVNPASALLVSCPGCGEPIRVPRRPHAREAATDTPALPNSVRHQVSGGLKLLSASVWAFVSAAACVAVAFLLRVTIGHPLQAEYPAWLPAVQVALAAGWFVLAGGGCACRACGYLRCRPAADRYSLAPWATAAAVGAGMAAAGALAVVPAVIGRPTIALPPVAAGFFLLGLATGLLGVVLEFAFLPLLNRLLWETAGWRAADQTGRYVVAFVFGMVAVMGTLCLGVMAIILSAGGRDMTADAAGVSVQAKGIAVVVILSVCGIGGWLTWRFLRLLRMTRNAVNQPEPSPDPQVSNNG